MKKQEQRIIHLDDMLLYIVKRWKIFLIGVIVVGVIFGGIGCYKVHLKYSNDSEHENKIAVNVSGVDLDDVEAVLYLEKAIKNQREYNENSLLMRVNPMEKKVVSVKYQFFVSGDAETELSASLLEQGKNSYQNVLSDDSVFKFIKDELELDISTQYLKELVTTETDSVGVIIFNATAPDERMASNICAALQKYLSYNDEKILIGMDTLKVKKSSEKIVTVVDVNLQNTQTNYYNNLQSLRTSLNTRKAAMSEKAKEYLELSRTAYEEGTYESGQTLYKSISSGENVSLSDKVYDVIVYVLKRAILFMGLFIVFYAIKYMWSPKLMYAYDLWDMYGIRVIDVLSRKKPGIRMAAERLATCLDDANQIMMVMNKNATSSDIEIAENIRSILRKKGISVQILPEIDTPMAMDLLNSCHNAIMIEEIENSKYKDIKNTIENIQCMNIDIKGVVIIK